jgi:prepilin-type N-terminal cleavage/methylation domain-containing protein
MFTHRSNNKAFTLLELLSTITIIAVLVAGVVFVVPYFVSWAKQTSDKQTLTVLNDALTRRCHLPCAFSYCCRHWLAV